MRSKHKFMFNVLFFSPENRAVCEITWKNNVQSDRLQMTIWRMRFAFWITEATDTQSEYVIHTDFPRQQRLREHVSMFPHRYTACLELCVYQCTKHTAVATNSNNCILITNLMH